jgi:hypothetical protein
MDLKKVPECFLTLGPWKRKMPRCTWGGVEVLSRRCWGTSDGQPSSATTTMRTCESQRLRAG